MNEEEKKQIEEIARETFKRLNKLGVFTNRRIVDTPIEAFSIVNRRFVTLNGTVANRPRSSVATVGQPYFPTDTNIPMTFDGDNWRNGVGSIVSQGRN